MDAITDTLKALKKTQVILDELQAIKPSLIHPDELAERRRDAIVAVARMRQALALGIVDDMERYATHGDDILCEGCKRRARRLGRDLCGGEGCHKLLCSNCLGNNKRCKECIDKKKGEK